MDSKNLIFNELEKLYKSLPLINPLSKTLPEYACLELPPSYNLIITLVIHCFLYATLSKLA